MRHVFGLLAVSCLMAVENAPPEIRRELVDQVGHVVLQLRTGANAKLPAGAAPLRDLLRQPAQKPMSELSPPVALTRDVLPEGPGRFTVCVDVVRLGGAWGLRLGQFGLKFVRRAQSWELTAVDNGSGCPAAAPPHPAPHVILDEVPQVPPGE